MNDNGFERRGTTPACSDIEELMSGYVDGELTQQEEQRVRVHAESCPECARKLGELLNLKAQIRQLSYPRTDEEVLEILEKDLLSSSGSYLGWVLLVIGLTCLIAYAKFQFFTNGAVPLFIRVSDALIMVGGISLFVSVLRQRILTWKHDRYRKVKL